MSEKLNRFVDLMKSVFELDKSDLDFGIYRIMNIRKNEIEKFLAEGLPKKVQETLAPFASNTVDIERRIAEIEKQCADLGIEISASPKLAEECSRLKGQLTAGVDLSALETDVYSALYSFFNRYYDEGDFVSKRRYKEGVYAIPYEGEEVKLYWANQDQYYIKTTENFKDYTFVDGGRKVHFRLVEATTEQNNNKESDDKKRTFMLYEETDEKPELKTMEVVDGELYIRFVFDVPADKKIKYAEENYKKISAGITSKFKDWFSLLRPTATKDPKKAKSVIEKHLDAYVAKNTFDYFIHKDLRGFLTRELDFYIKSEVIHLDDVDTTDEKRVDTYIAKVKAIKRVGKIIIDFLAQIEDFQKKLWLKKKFVVSTDWCITLDNIHEVFYEEIIKNKTQVLEWIDMYAINEIEGDLTTVAFSEQLTMEFLRENGNLIVDTKHFTTDFKERLVASIDNIDERINGLLINSDNFHALNILLAKLSKQVKCIYIDPPYNADASEIMYKNGFKHSSWLSMMESRLQIASQLMRTDGMICLTIDDYEKDNASILLSQIFSPENTQGVVPIRNNPQGRSTVKGFAVNHEYALFSSKSPELKSVGRLEHSQKQKDRYSETDSEGKAFLWENFRKTGTDSNHADRPKQYYPIFINKEGSTYRIPQLSWNALRNSWDVLENPLENEVVLYPLTDSGEEKVWKWGVERVLNYPSQIKVEVKGDDIQLYRMNYYNEQGSLPNTWWDNAKYAAGSHGTNLLTDIFGANRKFLFPKSVYAEMDCIRVCNATNSDYVLDFFAGSATTGHAVININRDDNESLKYILVEMGEYFNTVTKPRMQKVIYSSDWKNGKPQNRNTGISHIIKYMRLESYEDALSNVKLSEEKHRMAALFGDEYLINYMLDVEAQGSLLDLNSFKMPFSYKMKINENNETKEKIVDLCETFNYLIGISVVRQSVVSYFKAEPDEAGIYEGAVKLTESIDGEFAFKQVEGTLSDGRRTLIIWRTITDNLIESNAALDAYFNKHRINPLDREFDIIYVNGDNNLGNLKTDDEHWKVNMIEPEFKQRMFEEV